MQHGYLFFTVFVLTLLLIAGCNQRNSNEKIQNKAETPVTYVEHPAWSVNANIYEVNIRQYTKEGTFKAFEGYLERLKKMGVEILWLMPVYPISEKKRKGTLGSYYAVKDYKAVNPEFGTMADLKHLVDKAHRLGFKVILDWVANHTGWDNKWIMEHPGWYTKDSTGKMISPFDWTDVADLNYDNKELWNAMIDALEFWVKETGIDGYRCDVAGMVPTAFWNEARAKLEKIKPVFMLAEAEQPGLHKYAFDMTYAWELHHIFNDIAKGKKNANDIEKYFIKEQKQYPPDAYRMNFITNHDENSWNGTVKERLGSGAQTFAVLTYTLPGMPLIYSGQEVGLNKRLKFFDKDSIEWNLSSPLTGFYTLLNNLKRDKEALWNGKAGGGFYRIKTSNDAAILAFLREKNGNRVFTIVNLSGEETTIKLQGTGFKGSYKDIFTNDEKVFLENDSINIEGWGYRVYVMK